MESSDGYPLLGISQRMPPANIKAEQALLGAIFANNKAYHQVAGFLAPEHFADPIHGRIYQSIGRRVEAGQLADAVVLKAEFEHSGILDDVGGTTYLAQLLVSMVGILTASEYGVAVHDCYLRRQLINVGEAVVNNAFAGDESGAQQVEQLEDEAAALRAMATAGATQRRGFTTLGDAVDAAVERADGIAGGRIAAPFSTGLPVIDRMIGGGISPDTLTYVVGAGGSGKTELSLQVAEWVALRAMTKWSVAGKPGPCPGVLYIMLGNMTATQIGARTAARLSGVRLRSIRRGELDMLDGERLLAGREMALSIPLDISDSGPSTLARIVGDMRRVSKQRPLVLTVIDNFSDLLSVSADKMFGTAIAVTKALKEGAQAMHTAVMLLMHVNASVDGARNRSPRPRPSDIPWGTKKDADFAFGLWRPILYADPEPPQPGGNKPTKGGDEIYAMMRQKWADNREPWPLGVRDITEVVSMKLREEDDDRAGEIGKLRFDRSRQTFFDVGEAKPPAEAGQVSAEAWG